MASIIHPLSSPLLQRHLCLLYLNSPPRFTPPLRRTTPLTCSPPHFATPAPRVRYPHLYRLTLRTFARPHPPAPLLATSVPPYRSRTNESSCREWPPLSDPPQEAEGQADAQAHGAGERGQVEGASGRRARVRAREGPDGIRRAHDRTGQARVKVGLVNLVYNMRRAIWLTDRLAAA